MFVCGIIINVVMIISCVFQLSRDLKEGKERLENLVYREERLVKNDRFTFSFSTHTHTHTCRVHLVNLAVKVFLVFQE